MKAARWLKASAVFLFLIFIGHTVATFKPMSFGPTGDAILAGMKAFDFNMMGSQRTYWDFYFAGNLCISLFVLMQSLILWFLADLVQKNPAPLIRILAVFLSGNFLFAIICGNYFFIVPTICASLATLSIGMALLSVQKNIKR